MEELLLSLVKAPSAESVREDYRAGLAARLGLVRAGGVYARSIAASPDAVFLLWLGEEGKPPGVLSAAAATERGGRMRQR